MFYSFHEKCFEYFQNKENEQKPSQEEKIKKVLPGNVAIEDLKVGQGAPAKPGKMVQVCYFVKFSKICIF